MPALQTSLGELGRIGLQKVFRIEAEKYPEIRETVLGNRETTDQTYIRMKSLIGLGPADTVPEGVIVPIDDLSPLNVQNFTPFKVGKRFMYSLEMAFVDQYNQIASAQGQIAQAFILKRNLVASGVDNLGFTAQTYGMVPTEPLYTTSHANGTNTGSNRPATDIALGPLAVAQCRSEIRQQKSARGQVMFNSGKIIIKVPIQLEQTATVLAESNFLPGTNNNDINFADRVRFQYEVIDYYTSSTAWFARLAENSKHGLFWLDQIPYQCFMLQMNEAAMYQYLAIETYMAGWYDWHGTWATVGA